MRKNFGLLCLLCLTKEMKKSTQVDHLGPSQAGFCKPPHQNRGQGTGSDKAQIDCCGLVVAVA